MSRLENKIPPPIVLLLCIALGWWLSSIDAYSTFQFDLPRWVVWAIVGLGLCTALAGVIEFRRARTTVDPLHPDKASSLVTSGVFRFTRNPMYLGMVIVLIGALLHFQSYMAFLVVPLFVVYIKRFQIVPEERAMQKVFGDAFTRYKQDVARWF